MLHFLFRRSTTVVISQNNNPMFLNRFVSHIPESPIVDFLITKCGLSLNKAISVTNTKRISWTSTDNPISVLSFLEDHGFSETQITKIVSRRPSVLVLDPHTNLKSKFDYLYNLGFSVSDFVKLFSSNPELINVSLKDQIIPNVDSLKNLIPAHKDVLTAINRHPQLLRYNLDKTVRQNIATLQSYSVPKPNISKLLVRRPRVLLTEGDRFISVVDEIKLIGFDPLSMNFVEAIYVISGTDKLTWEMKLAVYGEFGFSKEEVLSLFRSIPHIMIVSEEKIRKCLNFFMKKLIWEKTYISKYPVVLGYSMEKRIIPRCAVLDILISEGILSRSAIVGSVFLVSEKNFLEKFVNKHKKSIPQVLITYQDCLNFVDSTKTQESSNE